METRTPQNLVAKTNAAIAAGVAMGLLVASHHVAPADAATGDATTRAERPETLPAAYSAARFRISPAVHEPAASVRTFQPTIQESDDGNEGE
jgi:hypothetical protein